MSLRARAAGVLGVCVVVLGVAAGVMWAGLPPGSTSGATATDDPMASAPDVPAQESPAPGAGTPSPRTSTTPLPPRTSVVADASAAQLALASSREWWTRARAVVLAPADDLQAQLRAASVAVDIGAPVLVVDAQAVGEVGTEIGRLGAPQVLTVGNVDLGAVAVPRAVVTPLPDDPARLDLLLGFSQVAAAAVPPGGEVAAVAALEPGGRTIWGLVTPGATATPSSPSPGPTASLVLPTLVPGGGVRPGVAGQGVVPARDGVELSTGDVAQLAAAATARAAGVQVQLVPGGDPRTSGPVIDALMRAHPTRVLGVGSVFGSPELLAARLAVVSTGVQLPGGGQTVLPGKRYVALYGTPGSASLGALGEQDVPSTIARADTMAAPYRALTAETVVPTVEIIATIASGGPGPDGNFSTERPVADLLPMVQAAHAAGMYVVLDLQPGRADFLTQAQQYADLLAMPNVGLALDPEWRLAPDQLPLKQIGSVSIDEVNSVVAWLSAFSAERALPQKLFLLHEFSTRMIVGLDRLDTTHDNLALMVHVDGQGSQPAKAGTWATIRAAAPQVQWWGWKNFLTKDLPMLDPTQTYQVQPMPDLVTYQ